MGMMDFIGLTGWVFSLFSLWIAFYTLGKGDKQRDRRVVGATGGHKVFTTE